MSDFVPAEFKEEKNYAVDLTDETKASYCSLVPQDTKTSAMLFNAINTPDHALKDMINCTINITDVFAETVEVTNEATGETSVAPRIVLIDNEGHSYGCVSLGIYGSIKKLIGALGTPTWNPAVPLKVKQVSKGVNKNVLTLEIDVSKMK